MRPAQRFRHNRVNQTQPLQILGGQPQGLGCRGRLRSIAPQDGGASFRGDHRINRVFQHQHVISSGQCDGPTRPAFADYRRHQRYRRLQAGLDRAGDRLRLPTRLGIHSRKRARGIDKG